VPITLLFPIFLLAGLGALLARFPWLRSNWQAGVIELTAKLLIPALLFTSTYRTGLPPSVSWQLLSSFYLPLMALFLLVAYGARRRQGGAGTALAATYSNTVFVGLPVLVQTLGSGSLQFAYPVIAFHSLVCFTLYYLTGSSAGTGRGRLLRSLINAFTNPIVVSLFAGLAVNFTGLALPQALMQALDMLAKAALPCALLALGASLASLQAHRWTQAAAVVVTKLVALPLCVMALSVYAFGLPKAAAAVLVILASCPVGVNAAYVIAADGKDAELVNSSILLSSLACAATIPLWLWLLKLA
jgi:predicted permease